MTDTPEFGIHHVAYACKDVHETTRFYDDLMGFPLVHTEVSRMGRGFFRHVFFDTGDGSCVAFFDLHGAGEAEGWSTDLARATSTPNWVNHLAVHASEERQQAVRERMTAAGIKPTMVIDHGWCESHYYTDPNGILIELCRDTPGMDSDAEEARRLLDALPEGFEPARGA